MEVKLRKRSPLDAWEKVKARAREYPSIGCVILIVAGDRLAEELRKVKRFNGLSSRGGVEWPRA